VKSPGLLQEEEAAEEETTVEAQQRQLKRRPTEGGRLRFRINRVTFRLRFWMVGGCSEPLRLW